jgi:hypothetical protein
VERDTRGYSGQTVSLNSGVEGKHTETPVTGMVLLNAINSATVPDGKYFYNPQTGKAEIQWVQGIGNVNAPAPQARLMATVINGILTQKLPWGLVMLGVFIVCGIELLGIRHVLWRHGAMDGGAPCRGSRQRTHGGE